MDESGTLEARTASVQTLLLRAKFDQKLFEPIQCVFRVGPDRLERYSRAAIKVGAEHLEDTRRRESFLSLAQHDFGSEAHGASDEFRGRPRVQTELVDNLHFSPHLDRNIESSLSSFE
jgi:hypothetical protein